MRYRLLGLFAALSCTALVGQQPAENLILDAPAGKALPRAAQSTNDIYPPGVTPVRSRPITLNLDAIDPDAPRGRGRRRVRLDLFPGISLDVQETRARREGRRGRFSWSGRPANGDRSDVVLSVVDGRVSGSLSLRQGFFHIRHVQDGLHEVTELTVSQGQSQDDGVAPPALPPLAASAAKLIDGPATAAMGATPAIDILVVYTPEARARLGGSQNIQDRILLAVAEANTSFVNSAADLELNLVGMAETPVTDPQSATSSFLNQVTFSEPAIQSLRNHYGADLVSVWIDGAATGFIGIGWLNPGPPSDFSSYAYSVTHAVAAVGPSYTFAHEEGHNLGGAHDRANAANAGAFDYSYGYQYQAPGGGGFITLMSYSNGCSGCTPLNNWSNPNVLVGGVPTGVPQGQSNSADNALTLTQIAPSAELFRASTSPAPNLPPIANDQSRTVTSSNATPITLTGSDPNGHAIYFDVLTQPAHGALSGSGANLTYTGDVGYAGPDSFNFQVRDDFGGFDEGTVSLTVQLPSSNPPTVSLAQPAGGPFTAPASITLIATANDSDGSVDRVDFFANGQEIGTATSGSSTYTLQWENVLEGSYQVTAVAYDNLGISTTSSPVSVTVNAGGGGGAGYTTRMARLFYELDEGSGTTVFDQVGGNHGTVGGSATWTSLGLKGGWVDTPVSGFAGNRLSAASGDAFTVVWVGQLGTGSAYQTLFSMNGPSASNVQLRYYQPNGYMYLYLNGKFAGLYNATSLLGKVIMISLRCSGGSCEWRVGGSGPWSNAAVGTAVEANPLLVVGADRPHWQPHVNNTSSLFWVYGDALTDPEVDANFQYAGGTLNSRAGVTLDGYSGGTPNSPPNVTLAAPAGGPFTAPASINLVATASDPDGSVARVDFLADGSLIGSATSGSSTFSFNWTGVAAGSYSVVARAVDNLGASTDSSSVPVTVNPSGGGGGGYTTRAGSLFYDFSEGSGTTVFDQVGGNHGTVGGSATWTSLGLKGGWVDTPVSGFAGNRLSAASGDAFTVVWVGQLGTGSAYQTLFSMNGPSASNVQLRYYQPNGYMYLYLNGKFAGLYNATSLLGKVIMISLRCSGGSCEWRVGGSGPWSNAAVGTAVEANPLLVVGADRPHWQPHVNNTSSLFWVYGDALTDPEVDANFQYAGGTLNSRAGVTLDGYSGGTPNSPPNVTLAAPAGGPFTAPASINLVATASDPDGSVARVDFLADGSLIGSATSGSSTFSFNWTGVAAGSYSVVARAVDNLGASTDSSSVPVTVSSSGGGGGGYTTRAAQLFYGFDEGSGTTVFDQIGSRDGTLGGSATWTALGLRGGWVSAGSANFGGNLLSAASGNAFTVQWAGRLNTGNAYQTLFSVGDASVNNVLLRYYQPNGHLYLYLNKKFAGLYNASGLLGKVIMVSLRCSGSACQWRVGGSGPWLNGAVGTAVSSSPQLTVGADLKHWQPHINNASALFWVYSDSLTDSEVDANFQFAGSTLSSRAAVTLNGWSP